MLDKTRHWSMGAPSYISLTEIKAYAEVYGYTQLEELHEFVDYMTYLDDVYMSWQADKRLKEDEHGES